MSVQIGETICQYRQLRKMTQEEFASRLGVTPQAVSKWERGAGLPDVSLIGGICSVLQVSSEVLLGLTEKVVENGDPLLDAEIKSNILAEPLMVEASANLIPELCKGLETNLVYEKRLQLAKEKGILLPIIRFRDREELLDNTYRILLYGDVAVEKQTKDNEFYAEMLDDVVLLCETRYGEIINKNLVKILVDNVRTQYPGVVDGVVPEKVSYLEIKRCLIQKLAKGGSIKDLVRIIEQLEEELLGA